MLFFKLFMVYRVLARKLRPQRFKELLGQEEIVLTLQNALKSGRVGCAYLFFGPRGTGKTTVARIFAKCLNCHAGLNPEPCNECPSCIEISEGNSLDVHEIDGATYTQVDKIREIKEMVLFSPARDRYKIYIIDEVHMLSQSAFNAILKLLEEPPAHAIFIFATTEKHKVPATILSRCQIFNFHLFSTEQILNYLKEVIKKEEVKANENSLLKIAKKAQGSIRDALSILDQVISLSGKTIDDKLVNKLLGELNFEIFHRLFKFIFEGDSLSCIKELEEFSRSGEDIFYFYDSFVHFLRYCLKAKLGEKDKSLSSEELEIVEKTSQLSSYEEILRAYSFCLDNQYIVYRSLYPYTAIELLFLKLCELPKLKLIEEIIGKEERQKTTFSFPLTVKPLEKNFKERLLEEIEKKSVPLCGYLQEAMIREEEDKIKIFFKGNLKKAYDRCKVEENFKIIKEKVKEVKGKDLEVQLILEEGMEEKQEELFEDETLNRIKKILDVKIEGVQYLEQKKEEEDYEH